MKKILTLSGIILGCCLFALAQSSSYYRIPPGHSHQGSAEQFQSYSEEPAAMSANQSASQKTTVQGCLSQSRDGMFILSDSSGTSYQLNDSTSRLSQFVGKEIRVDGFGIFNGTNESAPGAISSGPSGLQASAQQIDVTKVRKIADSCQTRSGVR